MSYTELHKGKLKVIETDMSLEHFKDWLTKKEGCEVEDFEYLLEEGLNFF